IVEEHPVIIKPYNGGRGLGIRIVQRSGELATSRAPNEPVVVQEYIRHDDEVKVYVIGEEVFGIRMRSGDGRRWSCPISDEVREGAMENGRTLRVAIVGVGNGASSLVQGVEFYRTAEKGEFVPGLMHVNLGGYHVRDVQFSAAFDVVEGKVGLDLSEAIFAPPNNTIKFADVPKLNVRVHRGMTHDGVGEYVGTKVRKADGETANIVKILKDTGTDVVVNYLPVGSEMATKWYVEQVLDAGCAFVNCIPVFIASQPYWARRFAERGLPIIGDDIKSQVGPQIL